MCRPAAYREKFERDFQIQLNSIRARTLRGVGGGARLGVLHERVLVRLGLLRWRGRGAMIGVGRPIVVGEEIVQQRVYLILYTGYLVAQN